MASLVWTLIVLFLLHAQVEGGKKTCTKLPNLPATSRITLIRNKLKCGYDVDAAPKDARSGRVNTTISIDRHRLETYRVDGSDWFLSYSYVMLRWKDPRLKWDKTKYDNVSAVHVSPSEIWKPQVSALRNGFVRRPKMLRVTDDGAVVWILWWGLTAECHPVYTKWGDRRDCKMAVQFEPADVIDIKDVVFFATQDAYAKESTWSIEMPDPETDDVTTARIALPKFRWGSPTGFFSIRFGALKNTAIIDATLFAPAAVLLLLLLASTWVPAGAPIRLAVLAFTTLSQLYLLRFASRAVPVIPGRFSDYVLLYRDLTIASGLAFLLWCVSYLIACRHGSPGTWLQSIVATTSQSNVVRAILLIPSNPAKVHAGTTEGALLSVIVDRIAFIILAIVFTGLIVISAHDSEMRPDPQYLNMIPEDE